MLQLTAAARTEDRAERHGALRRFDEKLEHLRHGIALLDLGDANARALTRQRPEAKDDDARRAADPLAVGEYVGKFDLEFVAGTHGGAVPRRCVAVRQAPSIASLLRRSGVGCVASSDLRRYR